MEELEDTIETPELDTELALDSKDIDQESDNDCHTEEPIPKPATASSVFNEGEQFAKININGTIIETHFTQSSPEQCSQLCLWLYQNSQTNLVTKSNPMVS